ncbi:hypothetical protein evm_012443 [Chilo suppressalis]|nr:hypothetical protein evm_012443 [Chilo suppressalis]
MAATSVLCFAVLILVSLVSARDTNYVVDTYGDLSGVPVKSDPIYLPPPLKIWKVSGRQACDLSGVPVKSDPIYLPPPLKIWKVSVRQR